MKITVNDLQKEENTTIAVNEKLWLWLLCGRKMNEEMKFVIISSSSLHQQRNETITPSFVCECEQISRCNEMTFVVVVVLNEVG